MTSPRSSAGVNFEGGDELLEKPEESARSDFPVRQTMVYRPGDGSARSVQNDMRDLGELYWLLPNEDERLR